MSITFSTMHNLNTFLNKRLGNPEQNYNEWYIPIENNLRKKLGTSGILKYLTRLIKQCRNQYCKMTFYADYMYIQFWAEGGALSFLITFNINKLWLPCNENSILWTQDLKIIAQAAAQPTWDPQIVINIEKLLMDKSEEAFNIAWDTEVARRRLEGTFIEQPLIVVYRTKFNKKQIFFPFAKKKSQRIRTVVREIE